MRLVPPSHVANGVPYAPNVVYPPFIDAATSTFVPPRPPLIPPRGAPPLPPPLPPPPPPPRPSGIHWTIVNEVGDGACVLGCISRKIFGEPEQHVAIRANTLHYIPQHLHDKLPSTVVLYYHDAILRHRR